MQAVWVAALPWSYSLCSPSRGHRLSPATLPPSAPLPAPAPAGRGVMPTPGLHRAPVKHQPPAKTGRARASLAQNPGCTSSWRRPAFSWAKRAQTPLPERAGQLRSPRGVEKHLPGAVSPSSSLRPPRKCRGSGRGRCEDRQRPDALAGVWETAERWTSPVLLWVKQLFLLIHSQTMGKALGAADAATP